MCCMHIFSYQPPSAFPFIKACWSLQCFLINFVKTLTRYVCVLHLCVCVPCCKRLCLSVAMSSGDHVILPRPSGRTITECECVLAAGSKGRGRWVTERVQKYYPGYCIPYVRQDEVESFPLRGKQQTQL